MPTDSLTVLGIDPSMTATGLAIVKDGVPMGITTVRLGSVKDTDRGEQLIGRIGKLFNAIREFTDEYPHIDLMVVERTDWMRNLNGNPEWKKQYAIERRNQESLALLQGALSAYAIEESIKFMLLGVNEWHKEYGAGNKDAVMALLAQEFTSAIEYLDDDYYWVAGDCPYKLNNNETDALGIALVGYNRIKQEMMVTT